GLYGGYHTARGGFETVNDLSKNKAFEQSEDLKNVAHNRQEVNQTTVARKETLKTLADKQIPDRLGQEWTSEYIEANQDRAELAKRQAETAAGPKPSDAIAAAQGEDIPLDEQVANKTAFELRSDTPQDKLPKGATAQSAVDHEAGHVIVTKLVGGKSGEIQSYLHPEVSGRTSARTTVDFSGLQEDLSDDPEVAAEQVKNIVINKKAPAIMAGAAVDELLHGIPLEQNKGLAGDLEAIKNDCEAIGIGDEWTTVARRGFEQAKKLLQQSGMLDILQKHTATRDEGLSETLLMHEDRVQQMEEEAKNLHEQNQKGIERNNEESARPNGINLVPGGQRAVGGETNNGGILPVAEGQRPEIAYRAKEIYAGRKDNQIGTSAVPESGAGGEGREGIRRGTSETLPVSRNAGHIAPEEITYRTDANGTRWASSPDSPAEVSIPKNLTGPEAESYARDKLELQKNFATNRSLELTKDKEPTEAASVHAKEIQEALLEARSNAQRRVTTPEERQKIALQQDPKRPITPKQQKYIDYRTKVMGQVADELQEHGLLESGRRRPNYVMHALE
ncbi:MAG: hypothetical protein ACREQ5_14545, partial [Candidatus Dormibacteria bacterium]